MKIKKFNETASFDMENFIFKDVFGELSTDVNKINKSDKDVYTNLEKKYFNGMSDSICKIYFDEKDQSGLLWGKVGNAKYAYELGHVCFKNGKPHILTYINGDNMGCTTFNNVFISCGHDGQYLFNIEDPTDFKESN